MVKTDRNRDGEFEGCYHSKEETLIAWQEGWKYVFNTMNTLTPEHLLKTVYIRGEAHTVMQAIERQIAHYALHIGQIIYIGKMLKENEWECLSIPRGQSTRSVEKNVQHNNKKETDKNGKKKVSQIIDGSVIIRILPKISPYIIRKKLKSVFTGRNREINTCCRLKQSL